MNLNQKFNLKVVIKRNSTNLKFLFYFEKEFIPFNFIFYETKNKYYNLKNYFL